MPSIVRHLETHAPPVPCAYARRSGRGTYFPRGGRLWSQEQVLVELAPHVRARRRTAGRACLWSVHHRTCYHDVQMTAISDIIVAECDQSRSAITRQRWSHQARQLREDQGQEHGALGGQQQRTTQGEQSSDDCWTSS